MSNTQSSKAKYHIEYVFSLDLTEETLKNAGLMPDGMYPVFANAVVSVISVDAKDFKVKNFSCVGAKFVRTQNIRRLF